eukprot:1050698-Amphidinium_carterae.1
MSPVTFARVRKEARGKDETQSRISSQSQAANLLEIDRPHARTKRSLSVISSAQQALTRLIQDR